MYIGLTMTSRGNYKCRFCNHSVWKNEKFAIAHVDKYHAKERMELLVAELAEAQNKPPRVEYKDRVVYKDRPEPEYRDERVDVFCGECRVVMTGVRLPKKHNIHTTSCNHCGTTSLIVVQKIT